MNRDYETLLNMDLFSGISKDNLQAILKCLNVKKVSYRKNENIMLTGDSIESFGIVLSGTVQVLKEDAAGEFSIMSVLGRGETFAEVFVCAGVKNSPFTVTAASFAEVMFINYSRVITTCSNACAFHTALIGNMLRVLAQKNLYMNKKIDYLLLKGMRQKLAAFLLERYDETGTAEFEIPMNRSDLAHYLSVDRSAMSRELSRMSGDGLLSYNRNRFRLIDIPSLIKAQ